MMKRKNVLIIVLLVVMMVSVGSVLLVMYSEIVSEWMYSSRALLLQYLRLIGFTSILILVFLVMQNSKTKEEPDK